MSLSLTAREQQFIREHGEETYPHECCGFILGTARGDAKQTVFLRKAENTRTDSARNRYLIAPEEYLAAERDAQRRGLDIVGFYHSHPDHPAEPSEFDRSHALPWCSYVIVSVRDGKAADLRSWVLSEDYSRFEAESIIEAEPAR